MSAYSVKVDEISLIMGATVQGAVVSSECLPCSVEVISHYIDEVKGPGHTHTQNRKTITIEKRHKCFTLIHKYGLTANL